MNMIADTEWRMADRDSNINGLGTVRIYAASARRFSKPLIALSVSDWRPLSTGKDMHRPAPECVGRQASAVEGGGR